MSALNKVVLMKATLRGVAFFLFWAPASWAAKVETYPDLIEKAYNLSLQKDRVQAVNLLVNVAKRESKKSGPPREILAALDEVSGVFYSDKAQQLFELALSLRTTDPGLAGQKLNEAARLEPENQQILLEQIRLQIMTNDCDAAARSSRKVLERNPFAEDLKLALGQALMCQGQMAEYAPVRATADLKRKDLEIYWQTLEVESAFRSGTFAKGRDLSAQIQKLDSNFPESYYWSWKLAREQKQPDERSGSKYLAICKGLSSRAIRQYLAEPRLCRRSGEVEAESKKANGAGG